MEACSHLDCKNKATIRITTESGVCVIQCYMHFTWSYLENPAHTSFKVEKLDWQASARTEWFYPAVSSQKSNPTSRVKSMREQFMPFRELIFGNRFRLKVDGPEGETIYIKLGKNAFAVEQLAGVEMTMQPMKCINELVVYLP